VHSLSAGPDVGQARNASLKASGGAYGSERSVCWAKSGNGQINASVNNNNNKSSNNSSNNNATLRSAAPAHIELKSVAFENGSAGRGEVSFGHQINNNGNIIINKNDNQEIISSTYPPSPPADDAASARQLDGSDVPAAKPLTMANVSTLATAGASAAAATAVVGGSPFSAISTSPTTDEDDGESSEEEGDFASEISFSSNSSVSSSSIGNNSNITSVTNSNATNKDHQFLASVFGAGYLDSFTKLGVQVILPSNDVFPAELGLKGAAVLSAPQQGTKTLYLSPKEMEKLDSQTLVELLEIADEDLECSALVIALERKPKEDDETLAETLHALMYVGGAIVAPDAGVVKYDSEKFILVGLDL